MQDSSHVQEEPGTYSMKQEVGEVDGKWAVQVNTNTNSNANGCVTQVEMAESADDANKMVEADNESFRDKLNNCSCPEKVVYVLAVASLIVVAVSVVSIRWFLPYFYTALLSVIIPIRIWRYWKIKWQFFLLDWCYVANAVNLVYLWGLPHEVELFLVLYSICNGPVAWSIALFRNCLVPHSIERMTCLSIHLLPSVVMFVVRWYPTETSLHWYSDFPDPGQLAEIPIKWQFLWLFALPFACYMGHLLLYIGFIHSLLGKSEYLNNYTYLAYQGDGWISKAIKCYGGKCKFLIYLGLQFAYATLSIMATLLWYNFQAANIVFLCAMFLLATYNGSTYYLDLFPKKGYKSDPYRVCGKD